MAKSVTKADLISAIASDTGLKKVQAEKALAALTGAIQGALVDGKKSHLGWIWHVPSRTSQGPYGTRSADQAADPDQSEQHCKVQGRKSREGSSELARAPNALHLI
jgi:hypothetical protein